MLKKINKISLFILIILLNITNDYYSQPLTASQVFSKVAHSVVKVYAYDFYGNETSQGSGVVVDTNIIVTNYHVFDGREKIEIEHFGTRFNNIEILNAEPENDILVLHVKGLNLKSIGIEKELKIVIGENIFAIGSPKGYENTITEGIVSGIREEGIQISAGITHGSSGGAVVNQFGKLIGISYLGEPYTNININFAIPVSIFYNTNRWCKLDDEIGIKNIAIFCKAYNLTTSIQRQINAIEKSIFKDKLEEVISSIKEVLSLDSTQKRAKELLLKTISIFSLKNLNLEKIKELEHYMGSGFNSFIEGLEILENKEGNYKGFTKLIDAINLEPQNSIYYYSLAKHYSLTGHVDLVLVNMLKAYRLENTEAKDWLLKRNFIFE